MLSKIIQNLFKQLSSQGKATPLKVEQLGDRIVPSNTSSLFPYPSDPWDNYNPYPDVSYAYSPAPGITYTVNAPSNLQDYQLNILGENIPVTPGLLWAGESPWGGSGLLFVPGLTEPSFPSQGLNSSEPIASQLQSLYQTFLNRTPDAVGENYWQKIYTNIVNAPGGSAESATAAVTKGIKESYEYQVQKSYQTLLGRWGELSGVNYWMVKLENEGAPAVVDAIMSSGEYKAKEYTPTYQVNQLYQLLLSRPADSIGSVYWTNRLTANGVKAVIDGIFSSAEYRQNHD